MRFFSSSIGSSPRSSLKLFDSLAAQRRDARPAGRAAAGALGATRGSPRHRGAAPPQPPGTRGHGDGEGGTGTRATPARRCPLAAPPPCRGEEPQLAVVQGSVLPSASLLIDSS